MPVLHASVSDEIKMAWKSLARSSGQSESELLRQVVVAILSRNERAGSRAPVTDEAEQDGAKDSPCRAGSIRLEFKAHEIAAIERAAAKLGWKRNTWLISQVRAQLFREPRTTEEERGVLMRSTAELRAIGRNLNQIARTLHRGEVEEGSLTVAHLEQLHDIISRHADRVSHLLEAAEHRWSPAESFGAETSRRRA